jgi:hypothetical protein
LKSNSDLLLRAANRFGLRIAVCYEDQTVTHLQKAASWRLKIASSTSPQKSTGFPGTGFKSGLSQI